MKLTSIALALVLWLSSGLRADVTIRYQSEFKPSAALQPILEQVMKSVETGSTSSVRMKGNKAYTTSGNWIQIFDFAKQEVTLVDSAHKTYAAFPISQFADQMAGAIPQATSEQNDHRRVHDRRDVDFPRGCRQSARAGERIRLCEKSL